MFAFIILEIFFYVAISAGTHFNRLAIEIKCLKRCRILHVQQIAIYKLGRAHFSTPQVPHPPPPSHLCACLLRLPGVRGPF